MNRDHALAVLRRLRASLEARGIAHAALFGSVARGQGVARSDVDVVIIPVAGRRLDLFDLGGVQTLLDEGFGRDVDVIVEPVRKPELRRAIARDRADAF
jgi:predicted nucleotidyltransferase